jgi:hypothetical protein
MKSTAKSEIFLAISDWYRIEADRLKRLARSAGRRLKRGRPPTTPRVHKSDISDLIEATQ